MDNLEPPVETNRCRTLTSPSIKPVEAIFGQKSGENRENSGMIMNKEIRTTIVLAAQKSILVLKYHLPFK